MAAMDLHRAYFPAAVLATAVGGDGLQSFPKFGGFQSISSLGADQHAISVFGDGISAKGKRRCRPRDIVCRKAYDRPMAWHQISHVIHCARKRPVFGKFTASMPYKSFCLRQTFCFCAEKQSTETSTETRLTHAIHGHPCMPCEMPVETCDVPGRGGRRAKRESCQGSIGSGQPADAPRSDNL